jgi:hypothetical protein
MVGDLWHIQTMSLALSPMYLSTIAEDTTFKKFASILLAMALANKVFPVPGGPYRSTPCIGVTNIQEIFSTP